MRRDAYTDYMKVTADIQVTPNGVGTSLSQYVAACEKVITDAGLNPRLHAHGTNVEGDWEAVMDAVRKCHDVVHEMGAPRVSTSLKISTRSDKDDSTEGRIKSVQSKM